MVKLITDIFASKEKKKGLRRAGDNLLDFYNRGKEELQPWQDQGEWALAELKKEIQNGPEPFEMSPEYQHALQQGTDSRNDAAAAAGSLDSGGYQKNMTEYGQRAMLGFQQMHIANWQAKRLSPLWQSSEAGRMASAQMAQMAMQTGGQIAGIEIGKGNVAAGMWQGIGSNLTDMATTAVGANVSGTGDFVKSLSPTKAAQTASGYGDGSLTHP